MLSELKKAIERPPHSLEIYTKICIITLILCLIHFYFKESSYFKDNSSN